MINRFWIHGRSAKRTKGATKYEKAYQSAFKLRASAYTTVKYAGGPCIKILRDLPRSESWLIRITRCKSLQLKANRMKKSAKNGTRGQALDSEFSLSCRCRVTRELSGLQLGPSPGRQDQRTNFSQLILSLSGWGAMQGTMKKKQTYYSRLHLVTTAVKNCQRSIVQYVRHFARACSEIDASSAHSRRSV